MFPEEIKVPKTIKGRQMRNKILEVARATFSKKGYPATRIIDITKEIGISEGNFYRYFKSKDEIMKIIMEDFFSQLYKASGTGDIEGTFEEKLFYSTKRLFKVYQENAEIYKVLLSTVHYDESFYAKFQEVRSVFVRRIRKQLDHFKIPDDIDKDYVAQALCSMFNDFTFWCILGGDKEKTELDVASHSITSIWINYINSYDKSYDKAQKQF